MRVLHTSDWHLGRSLFGQKRYEEFSAFLDWLARTLQEKEVDVLVVSGDIFDSGTPSNRAQRLYYDFLRQVYLSSCRHVVITAGNHDSPSMLGASREILQVLDVHVVGNLPEDPAEEIKVLRDAQGKVALIVCAVPFLRDADMRLVEEGESSGDKESKMQEAIRRHYAQVLEEAAVLRDRLAPDVPLLCMGHLFTAGGQTVDGDGVRDLYVGSLAHVPASIFPPCVDYLALGHLHVPQRVGGMKHMRYSGSPLPMGFGEASQPKSVCLIDFAGRSARVELLSVPEFQKLERVSGSMNDIRGRLAALRDSGSSAWLEVVYTGDDLEGSLRQQVETAVAGSGLRVLKIRNARLLDSQPSLDDTGRNLEELSETEVFSRCLAARKIEGAQADLLMRLYGEILTAMHETDSNAE